MNRKELRRKLRKTPHHSILTNMQVCCECTCTTFSIVLFLPASQKLNIGTIVQVYHDNNSKWDYIARKSSTRSYKDGFYIHISIPQKPILEIMSTFTAYCIYKIYPEKKELLFYTITSRVRQYVSSALCQFCYLTLNDPFLFLLFSVLY